MSLFRRKTEQTWDSSPYIWLENTGNQDIKLQMPSGNLRLDLGRKYRFQPDIMKLPQVKSLISDGQLTVRE